MSGEAHVPAVEMVLGLLLGPRRSRGAGQRRWRFASRRSQLIVDLQTLRQDVVFSLSVQLLPDQTQCSFGLFRSAQILPALHPGEGRHLCAEAALRVRQQMAFNRAQAAPGRQSC